MPGRARLLDHLRHLVRREELRLLHVHRLPGRRDRHDEVGLPAEERGRLQHVDDGRDGRDLRRLVDVGQHRQAGLAPHLVEDRADPSSMPTPRNEPSDVRFALSNDDL